MTKMHIIQDYKISKQKKIKISCIKYSQIFSHFQTESNSTASQQKIFLTSCAPQ